MVKQILVLLSFFLTNCYADFCYDLAILTVPKSGSHLLEKALRLITRQEVELGRTVLINGKLVLLNHLWPEMNSVIYNSNKFRVILFRDLRDVLISQMFYVGWPRLTEKQEEVFLSMPEYEKINFLIDMNMQEGVFYYSKLCSELIDDPRVIAFRFEDLVGPEGGGCRVRQEEALKKLALILGQTITTNEITEIALQLFGNTRTFYKGQIGSWKQYFSDEHKSIFKEKMGEYLIKLGYEKDDQW